MDTHGRHLHTRILQSHTYPLFCFTDFAAQIAYHLKAGQAGRYVHLHLHGIGVNTGHGTGMNGCKHEYLLFRITAASHGRSKKVSAKGSKQQTYKKNNEIVWNYETNVSKNHRTYMTVQSLTGNIVPNNSACKMYYNTIT